jgi:hypothetical protein
MDKDATDRGPERLMAEERERAEIEMRADMARARMRAGDGTVTLSEAFGDPYNLLDAIRDVRRATDLPLYEAKLLLSSTTGASCRSTWPSRPA